MKTINDVPDEIFILILEALGREDMLSLLVSCRVSSRFRATISNATTLQKILYLQPVGHGDVEASESRLNPVVETYFKTIIDNTEMKAHRHLPRHHNIPFSRLPFVEDGVLPERWLRTEASWRRMMLTERPITHLGIICSTYNEDGLVRKSCRVDFSDSVSYAKKTGMTLGHYYDLLLRDIVGDPCMYPRWIMYPRRSLVNTTAYEGDMIQPIDVIPKLSSRYLPTDAFIDFWNVEQCAVCDRLGRKDDKLWEPSPIEPDKLPQISWSESSFVEG